MLSDFSFKKLGHESSFSKQGFLQDFRISSCTKLREHPNFVPNTDEGFPNLETESYVDYFVYFSGFITIHSYFFTIILIIVGPIWEVEISRDINLYIDVVSSY